MRNLKGELHQHLKSLNDSIPDNKKVKILDKDNGHIKITPLTAQPAPLYLDALQREVNLRWSTINLIDMLKEADCGLVSPSNFKRSPAGNSGGGSAAEKASPLLICAWQQYRIKKGQCGQ